MSEPLKVALESIPLAFEGIIPSAIATVSADGTPNVTFLSVIHLAGEQRVALSRQFFKKTDENTLENPYAQVSVLDPGSGRTFRLDLKFEETVTDGPLFERMSAKLDAVAAHEGMANIFRLKGTDVCEVLSCEAIPCDFLQSQEACTVSHERVAELSARLAEINDLDQLLLTALLGCEQLLETRHAFAMLVDDSGERLQTVLSIGYATSGEGSEVRIGEGLIGVAAEKRQSIRVTHLGRDLMYSQASRDQSNVFGGFTIPRLPEAQSVLVTPMLASRTLVGVLCFQSAEPGAFSAEDESVVGILAAHVARRIVGLREGEPAAS